MIDARLERDTQILRVIRVAILAAATVWVAMMTFTDPDLWGHIRFGQDIIASGGVPRIDHYSFTSDRMWINHEWLAEVTMYLFYAAAGTGGLVTLKMLVLAGVAACVLTVLRRRSAWRPVDRDFLLTVAIVGMMPRATSVRPQLFSLLLFAVLLLVLTTADRRPRALFALPPIFCIWANLHGAYFVGLLVTGLWIALRLWQTPHRWGSLAAAGIASVGATLVNPYGVELWRFLFETVGTSRPEIVDWAPAYSHPNLLLVWMIVLLTAGTAVWRVRGRVDLAPVAVVSVLCLATLRVSRIDAFFAIGAVMLLGPAFGREPRVDTSKVPWRPWLAFATGVILLAAAPAVFAHNGECLELEGPEPGVISRMLKVRSPYIGAPEREAASYLRQQRGRMLVYFDWGEYAIWHFPHLKVSIDGRRETVYSDALYQAHGQLYRGASTALVHQLQPDFIWLPVRMPVISILESEGWHAAFRGPVSVVLTREPADPVRTPAPAPTAPRCFPAE